MVKSRFSYLGGNWKLNVVNLRVCGVKMLEIKIPCSLPLKDKFLLFKKSRGDFIPGLFTTKFPYVSVWMLTTFNFQLPSKRGEINYSNSNYKF
jgi:hypothetical protein